MVNTFVLISVSSVVVETRNIRNITAIRKKAVYFVPTIENQNLVSVPSR